MIAAAGGEAIAVMAALIEEARYARLVVIDYDNPPGDIASVKR